MTTESGKVLVVLFGWMGAHTKHVQKYADWWEDNGCDTLIFCGTPFTTYYPPGGQQLGMKAVQQIEKYVDLNPDCSILFHAFSNGGGFPLSRVLGILEDKKYEGIKKRVKVNVLDSMLDMFAMSAIRAFSALGFPFFVNFLFYLLFPVLLLFTYILGFFHTMLRNYTTSKIPSLVIYSSGDKICHAHEIEYFINQLRTHGIPTKSQRFGDTAHVSHFRYHPIEYTQAIREFVAEHGLVLGKQ